MTSQIPEVGVATLRVYRYSTLFKRDEKLKIYFRKLHRFFYACLKF
jgi:hypothetical protein